MKMEWGERGFHVLAHPAYGWGKTGVALLRESSTIGPYDDAADNPGSSYLWVGDTFHLNREEVETLIGILGKWLDTGRLGFLEDCGGKP